MQFSDDLKNLIGPGMATVTKCGAPEVEEFPPAVIHAIFSSINYRLKEPFSRYKMMFLRRSQQAHLEYRAARKLLLEYVTLAAERKEYLELFIESVSRFEQAITSTAQAHLFVGRMIGKKLREEGSDEKLLYALYNRVKHFDEDLTKDEARSPVLAHQDSFITSPIWITNDGLSSEVASLSWIAFGKILAELRASALELMKPL